MIPDPTTGRVLRIFAVLAYTACAVFALVAHTACNAPSEQATPTRRIVSIGGSVTETVFAVGPGGEAVAVNTSSVYPSRRCSSSSDILTPPHLTAAYSVDFEVLRGASGLVIVSR